MNERAWRVRPIFVSSTFKDMHAERDWLRDHVFPELVPGSRHNVEARSSNIARAARTPSG